MLLISFLIFQAGVFYWWISESIALEKYPDQFRDGYNVIGDTIPFIIVFWINIFITASYFIMFIIVGLMEKEIQKSSVESQASLLEQAVEIARATKQTGQDFHDFSGRLAFAFAKTGNRKAVDGIAREIVDSKRQAWILFQCIRAMPASEASNQRSRYESYRAGGLF